MTRVVVTGVGIISCLGQGRQLTLEAIQAARSGIRVLRNIDTSNLNCRIGGEVSATLPCAGQDRFTRLALVAAAEAAEQAGYQTTLCPERTGTIIGTGFGGCETLDANYRRLYRDGATRLPPTVIPSAMYNAAASAISSAYQARGVSFAVVSACAASTHAVGLAYQAILAGQADVMFAGGADAPLVTGSIRAWEALRVLAVDNEHPERACRPFSADRQGLVLAEGAAVLVLESHEHARRRGAVMLGEIAGYGASSDAGHITDPSADGAARAMTIALGSAHLHASDVGYINAHGTGTRANDLSETVAIKQVFGNRAHEIPISSTKSIHGHVMGASGAVEIACSLIALNEGLVPATINLERADPTCDLDYVADGPREQRVSTFLSNSFGFGGMNAVVAVRTRLAPGSPD